MVAFRRGLTGCERPRARTLGVAPSAASGRQSVFSNLNWWNVAVLLLLALFIFGDKLPQMISDGLRMLRNLRRMAQNATSDLGRELGTDLQLEDLHPRTFVRKHLLSEADQEELTRPLKDVSEDLSRHVRGVGDEVRGAGQRLTGEGATAAEPPPQPDVKAPRRLGYDDIT
jgi:sec-independent protein translocase protein TatB